MLNKLLAKQINTFLGSQENLTPELTELLNTVSKSYDKFEKEKSKLKHFNELNISLQKEVEENKLVFKKLRESLMILRNEEDLTKKVFEFDDLNLLSIAELLITETKKRREAEYKLKNNLNDLEKINKELDQFAYVVSHDLKAPLRAISSLTTWLEEDLAGSLTVETKNNFITLKARVERLENLINGILEYSKVAKSNLKEQVSTKKLITEIINSLDCPSKTEIKLITDFPDLQTEKIHLIQVFTNLISNAIKYNNKEIGLIEIGCDDFEEWTQFYVKDNGLGIDKKFHQKIFAIFQTLETKDNLENTGIGLAIVKKIVEEHKGKIWVESEPGRGSKFIFTWPKTKTKILINHY